MPGPVTFEQIIPLSPNPGVNRDSTKFSGNNCVDSQWCRFYYGKPRKIGGYQAIDTFFPEIQYGSHVVSQNKLNYFFSGSASNLYVSPIYNNGTGIGLTERTPASFVPDPNTTWQFSDMFDVGSEKKLIFAHGGRNLAEIASDENTTVYYGDATANTPLLDTTQSVSGGVTVVHPYPMLYGNDGFVQWPAPGTVDFMGTGAGSLRITGSKIVKGYPVRGGAGFSPSGLFWSLDSLQRLYFVGGTSIFANDHVGDTAPLSSSAIVECNGLYYWPTSDKRFSVWNGAIQDIPNNYNLQYFFKNLNFTYRQKVWGIRIAAFNEIWWFYPSGMATECNAVIILNYKDNIWYDTLANRSTGVPAKVFPYPIMFDNQQDPLQGFYRAWQHEFGVDRVVAGQSPAAIPSWFESDVITLVDKAQGPDKWTRLEWFEQDFIQSGALTLNVTGEEYNEGPTTESEDFTLPENVKDKTYTKEQRRFLRIRVESNVVGGDYYMGKPLLKIKDGNGRQFVSKN